MGGRSVRTVLAVVAAIVVLTAGMAWGTAGQPLIMGTSNSAGTANTTLSTASTGVGLGVTQSGGLGPALQGIDSATTAGATGVLGYASGATSNSTYGVRGTSASTAGRGVFGNAYASSGITYGVYGTATSPTGYGVYSNGRLGIASGKPLVCTGCVTAGDLGTNAAWGTSGNAATASSFLGTTNSQPLVLKVNGVRALRIESTASTPNLIGGFSGNTVTSGVVGATISGGGTTAAICNANTVTDDFGTVAGGCWNQAGDNAGTTSDFELATVGGGIQNTASGSIATVGGGIENIASGPESTVAGGQNNHATGRNATVAGGLTNTASGDHATVGGGSTNTASATDSTIAGGVANFATGTNSGVTGGSQNSAGGIDAAVTGGFQNSAGGDNATVGGGTQNFASGTESFVAGGEGNIASGARSIVAGGAGNIASGTQSFVAGGTANHAAGTQSWAAGTGAVASDDGSFVWADGNGGGFNSNTFPCTGQANCTPTSGVNTFNVRATGGVRFVTALNGNGEPLNGCYLAAGGGTWLCLSDRRAKRGFRPVEDAALLRALARMPVKTWSFRAEPGAVRHMGPTAQAFWRAFHLGSDRSAIGSVDEAGVALAAVKALYGRSVAQIHTIDRLRGSVRSLHARLSTQGRQIATLQKEVKSLLKNAHR